MTESRPKPIPDKAVLVCDLRTAAAALEADRSPGICLPTNSYDRLRYSVLDAIHFLEKRRMGRGSR